MGKFAQDRRKTLPPHFGTQTDFVKRTWISDDSLVEVTALKKAT